MMPKTTVTFNGVYFYVHEDGVCVGCFKSFSHMVQFIDACKRVREYKKSRAE